MRAKGMGSNVIVTEVDPIRALEAAMDGFRVMPMKDSAPIGDVFITVTGGWHTLTTEHYELMKDGAIMANSGHFNVELNIPGLEDLSIKRRNVRPFVDEYTLSDSRKLYLLADGRLINLAAAEGHPSVVMDMSFANQALCTEYLVSHQTDLKIQVYGVPNEIDKEIGRLKLEAMNIHIDTKTT